MMKPGEKRPVADVTTSREIRLSVSHSPADVDIAAFGLNADRKIGDDRYVVLFSNERSPEGALTFSKGSNSTTITVNLDRLPSDIHRVSITATHDHLMLRQASVLSVDVSGSMTIDAKPLLGDEKAVVLLDLYRHGSDWRIGAVIQGFNGGLAALVQHFGGDVEDDAGPSSSGTDVAPSSPQAPVTLGKVDLRKQKVGVSLKKLGIEHEKAEVTFVMDGSGSMAALYANGTVQETVERSAPVALRLDDDGSMDTWFYASSCAQVEALTDHNLEGFVERTLPRPGARIGASETGKKGFFGGAIKSGGASIGYGNNEPVVMRAILESEPEHRRIPRLVIFVTDGGIDRTTSSVIKDLLRESSAKGIFWQFVGVGNANYGVLRELDTVDGRVIDNAGFFSVDDLSKISDDDLYDRILSEFPAWLRAARSAGILP
ncbi:VWA domain-containing protein [Sphingomonas sp. 3-13AW]|uniref:VWA domain-containing protein n=1 Tax=Sphingomonas sp. 3-13AW TaxID=3050450 RepID=UPI003BB7CFED